jgi:hypothetical protein
MGVGEGVGVTVGGIGVAEGVHVAAMVGEGRSVGACVGVSEARRVAVAVGVAVGDAVAVSLGGTGLGVREGGGAVGTAEGVCVGMI